MSDELLQAWREHLTPRLVTLSRGLQVMVRPVTMESLVVQGTIPLTLFHESQKSARARGRGAGGIDEEFLKMMPGLHAVVMAAAVSPRIAEAADLDNGVVSIHDIELADRLLIFEEANKAARALHPFRGEPAGDDHAAPDGDDVPAAAE